MQHRDEALHERGALRVGGDTMRHGGVDLHVVETGLEQALETTEPLARVLQPEARSGRTQLARKLAHDVEVRDRGDLVHLDPQMTRTARRVAQDRAQPRCEAAVQQRRGRDVDATRLPVARDVVECQDQCAFVDIAGQLAAYGQRQPARGILERAAGGELHAQRALVMQQCTGSIHDRKGRESHAAPVERNAHLFAPALLAAGDEHLIGPARRHDRERLVALGPRERKVGRTHRGA